jgi:hypothetical protein
MFFKCLQNNTVKQTLFAQSKSHVLTFMMYRIKGDSLLAVLPRHSILQINLLDTKREK